MTIRENTSREQSLWETFGQVYFPVAKVYASELAKADPIAMETKDLVAILMPTPTADDVEIFRQMTVLAHAKGAYVVASFVDQDELDEYVRLGIKSTAVDAFHLKTLDGEDLDNNMRLIQAHLAERNLA